MGRNDIFVLVLVVTVSVVFQVILVIGDFFSISSLAFISCFVSSLQSESAKTVCDI